MAKPDDFESWARETVAKREGRAASDRAFDHPNQGPPRPGDREIDEQIDSFAELGAEVLIECGDGITAVLTPSRSRAAFWDAQERCFGITPREVTLLGKVTTGPISGRQLEALARVKSAFPGARIEDAIRKGEDNGVFA